MQPHLKCNNCEADATSWCVDCSEFICGICVNAHQRIKATRLHAIITKVNIGAADIICTNCTDRNAATAWCSECVSFICELCLNAHRRLKSATSHGIISKRNLSDRLASNNDASEEIMITQLTNVPVRSEDAMITQLTNVPVRSEGAMITQNDNVLVGQPIMSSQMSESSDQLNTQSNDAPSSGNELEDDTMPDTSPINPSGTRPWFHLPTVLKETTEGRNILSFYKEKQMLLPKHQKKLLKLILQNVFSTKKVMNISERGEIARQISLLFMKENSVSSFLFICSNSLSKNCFEFAKIFRQFL